MRAGYGTAIIGKKGPALIQDHTARDAMSTIIIDDSTGKTDADAGVKLPRTMTDALTAAFTKVVLPALKSRGKPFFAIFWSRDPDSSQHAQSDSKGRLMPGGAMPSVKHQTLRSKPAENGLATIVEMQNVGETRCLDAGGFPGRSVGIPAETK